MAAAKILIADQIALEGARCLEQHATFQVVNTPGLDQANLREIIADCDAVIVRSATKITVDIINAAKRLRVIGRAGIGVDNIDVGAATAHGIVVLNTPDANATTTAELAIAHLLALSRHLNRADRSVREGQWLRNRFLGSEVSGKTVGVVGFGTIGRIVATRCQGLSMHVIAYDPFVRPETMLAAGAEPSDLDALLSTADYVTIHCPLSAKTRNLINAERLRLMKPTARLINCARGGLVDEAALYEALKADRIAGAALDVYEQEPPVDSPLLTLDNVSFTPHLGASTEEAQLAAGVAIAGQVAAFLATGEAISAVNLPHIAQEQLHKLQPYQELARKLGVLLSVLTDSPLQELEVHLQGKVADLDVHPIAVDALVGYLREHMAINVNNVNAFHIAKEAGLKVVEAKLHEPGDYVSAVRISGTANGDRIALVGTLLAERFPRLVRIDNYDLEAELDGTLVMTRHADQPGVIGDLGKYLGSAKVNISRMQVGTSRTNDGTAMSVLNVSQTLAPDDMQRLAELPGMQKVYQALL